MLGSGCFRAVSSRFDMLRLILEIDRGLFTVMIIKHHARRGRWSELDQLTVDDLVNNPHHLFQLCRLTLAE
jgi:hypothetical protein